MKTVQCHHLTADDFTKAEPRVVVVTGRASNFEVECLRPGTYIAYGRTEFIGGMKTYKGIESLRRDLATR